MSIRCLSRHHQESLAGYVGNESVDAPTLLSGCGPLATTHPSRISRDRRFSLSYTPPRNSIGLQHDRYAPSKLVPIPQRVEFVYTGRNGACSPCYQPYGPGGGLASEIRCDVAASVAQQPQTLHVNVPCFYNATAIALCGADRTEQDRECLYLSGKSESGTGSSHPASFYYIPRLGENHGQRVKRDRADPRKPVQRSGGGALSRPCNFQSKGSPRVCDVAWAASTTDATGFTGRRIS